MKVHETADAAVDAQDTEKRAFKKNNIIFTKSRSQMDVTDIQSTAEGAETDAKTPQMRISRYLKRWMLTEAKRSHR